MNKFATIFEVRAYKLVTFYTVKFENEKYSEFEKFILNHRNNDDLQDEYQDMLALIERIGDKVGAKERYFSRHERKASALPPEWKKLPLNERRLHAKYRQNLRLYCLRITNEIVFLFNGGVKSPGQITAQQCSNVRKYFELANRLVDAIDFALMTGELNLDKTKLKFSSDLELIF